MNTITELFYLVLMYWMFALVVIGPFQVIAATIRAIYIENWSSNFGKRLKIYYKLFIGYWMAASVAYIVIQTNTQLEWLFFLFVPILCTPIAIYYWRAVYLLYKDKREFNRKNN